MNIKEAVEYIERVRWTERTVGLHRMRELLELLGHPEKDLKFIHVAGTNGKGSVCSMLESVMRASGRRTGLYTSPHLLKINERIKVDGECISDEDFCRYVEKIKEVTPRMSEEPTVFDTLTATGLMYFCERKVDIVILEVGLGGIYDSTNFVEKPLIEIVTTIGYDHMAILGNTLPEIASSKAGIIKKNTPVVVYGGEDEVNEVFRKKAREVGAELIITDFDDMKITTGDDRETHFTFKGFEGEYTLKLSGLYQRNNAAVVMTSLRKLVEDGFGLDEESIRKGMEAAYWPCRFEIVAQSPTFIVDGAHNPEGIRAVTDSASELANGRKVVFILGVMKDKDVNGMVNTLKKAGTEFFTLTPDSDRALDSEELAKRIREAGANAVSCGNAAEAVAKARECAGKDGIVCSIGSLYLAGPVREAAKDSDKE